MRTGSPDGGPGPGARSLKLLASQERSGQAFHGGHSSHQLLGAFVPSRRGNMLSRQLEVFSGVGGWGGWGCVAALVMVGAVGSGLLVNVPLFMGRAG